MTIRDLVEQFTIQGPYQIKKWNNKEETFDILAERNSFEDEHYKIKDEFLDMEIKYMYPIPTASGTAAYIVYEVE